jgi:hypothetical protein
VLTGLVLLTVTLTAILIHLTWFYAARRNVADVVGQLNRQIVGSVQHEVRGTLNDAWSVQEAVRSIFFQEAIKPTDEVKREFIFLALLRSHPTLSWIALGFPNGAFFGALRAADDEIDMVEVKRNPETGIRQQRVDTYTPEPGDVMFSRTRNHAERLRGDGPILVSTCRRRGRPGLEHAVASPRSRPAGNRHLDADRHKPRFCRRRRRRR